MPCQVAIGLLDAKDNIAATCWPSECEPKKWSPDKTVTETPTLRFAEARPGPYRLAVGLFEDRDAKSPWIRLAVEGNTMRGLAHLGIREGGALIAKLKRETNNEMDAEQLRNQERHPELAKSKAIRLAHSGEKN